jgi:hypothetical protein
MTEPQMSIGDFAANLIENGEVGNHVSDPNDPYDVDLTEVNADVVVNEVLSNITPTLDTLVKETVHKKPSKQEKVILTESQESKLDKLSKLLREAANLIDEMTGSAAVGAGTTTVGCIGTNMAGPSASSPKKKVIKKRKKKEKSISDIIKENLSD